MEVAYDICTILYEISQVHEDLGDTITESLKGATAMGGSSFSGALVGGLVAGPVGMIVGGAIGMAAGATYAAANVKSFKPLHQVISEMTVDDKRRLKEAAKLIIQRHGIDIATQIIGHYESQLARSFLVDVFKEFKGQSA